MPPFPARLHVLLAREAPVGLIIRRGPSHSVASVLWNRRTDRFTLGQWLRGRIYERRCDLSPDGTHVIYFAMNGRWQSDVKGSYTAIARAPYLKAVTLFPKGDCWQGGGLFTTSDRYWLNGCHDEANYDSGECRRDPDYRPVGSYGGECPSVYYHRLQRDGWILMDRLSAGSTEHWDIFEKPVGNGWVLRKIAHAEVGAPPGKGCYWDEHELIHADPVRSELRPDWEWADLDGTRLVWAAGGILYASVIGLEGLSNQRTLFDSNDMAFQCCVAPY
jgi:hypothetical protein